MDETRDDDYLIVEGRDHTVVDATPVTQYRRPMLMMSTASWLRDHPDHATAFIAESLGVTGSWNWATRVSIVRQLLRWFFDRWWGRAWISTSTDKIRANNAIERQGATPFDEPDETKRCGNTEEVELGFGLTKLPVKIGSFAPLQEVAEAETEFTVFVRRRFVQDADGRPWLSYDYSLFRTEQGSGDEFFKDGYVPVSTIDYGGELFPAYSCWHVFCCMKCHLSPACITHLHMTLHPGDTRFIALTTTRRPVDVWLKQHPIERDMLQDKRFLPPSLGAQHE